jgi:X-Pro dipeptidyl-peptidase
VLRRALLLVAVLAAGVGAVPAAAAPTVSEVLHVDTAGGARIRVEVTRDTGFDRGRQPVLLTYTPYTATQAAALPGGDVARWNSLGYAVAVADVLGTGGSTGCWDVGGLAEQRSGADVVRALARLPWSSGKVGMTGTSYAGTTATMVAALGDSVTATANGGRGLAAILPVGAVARRYATAYSDGVRWGGAAAAAPVVDGAHARPGDCGAEVHAQQAYDGATYGPYWQERDHLRHAARVRVPVLVVHDWQDALAKPDEALALYEALPVDDPRTKRREGVPFKRLRMSQGPPTGAAYDALVQAFWDRTLKGVANGFERTPAATSVGRTHAGPTGSTSGTWPPRGTRPVVLHLGRAFDQVAGVPSVGPAGTTGEDGVLRLGPQDSGSGWTHVSPGTVSEELSVADPANTGTQVGDQPVRSHGYAWLFHRSEPLTRDVRLAGAAVLDAVVTSAVRGQHLTPVLVEVRPDGTAVAVTRGFLNLDYRAGLTEADPATGWVTARVRFLPQDHTFGKGNRIGLLLQGSNTSWAVPGSPGELTYAMGPLPGVAKVGTRLTLPLVGPAPLPG